MASSRFFGLHIVMIMGIGWQAEADTLLDHNPIFGQLGDFVRVIGHQPDV